MKMRQQVLAFFKQEKAKAISAETLIEGLALKGNALKEVWEVLQELEDEAALCKSEEGKYGLPERLGFVVGRLTLTAKGFGFVIPDLPPDGVKEEDVYIATDNLASGMHNDRVVVRLGRGGTAGGRSREGEIVRIVERANSRIVGTFEANARLGFVTPDDKRIGQDIFITQSNVGDMKTGAKVVVEITSWPQARRSAEGVIVEFLGQKGEAGVEVLSIIKQHGLPVDFPEEVLNAAKRVPLTIKEDELTQRKDLRHLPVVTIDGEDAKDLDDAVYVEPLANGNHLLGVYIADVSYYIKENSVLDVEGRNRATSVYLADRVVPMLPTRLSNGICSLNANEDRLILGAHMEIDAHGQVVKHELFPGVIRVCRRLSYTIVKKILVDKDAALAEEYKELVPHMENMATLCAILRKRRMKRGAIDFDFPELKIKLDEQGVPVAVTKRERTLAESIVEEFMLIANETVAEHMNKLKVPFVYRVHEEPDEDKMIRLNNMLHNFGHTIPNIAEIKPMALQKVLQGLIGRPEERMLSTVMLRSLKQARYEAANLGHFGLAAEFYTHFTSPIRRYPDLIVHRLLRESWQSGGISEKRKEQLTAELPPLVQHCSQRERAAAEAERDTVDLKAAEYMARFVGETMPGFVSGVTSFGMFVELEIGIEGMVRLATMDDDYYQYIEDQFCLIGQRTKNVYRLGDAVKVKVYRVSVDDRQIDFLLLKEGHTSRGKAFAPSKKGQGRGRAKLDRGRDKKRSDKLGKAKIEGAAPQLLDLTAPAAKAESGKKHHKKRRRGPKKAKKTKE
ncbi:ribonuclease R [Azotosporobacter soli]|uniref:ribonuclease R n=1 Tax=Azotosporobacter soli TaxID=3055040 RepID=UPI0031FEB601